jgi:phosphate transport system substrate-binding protein
MGERFSAVAGCWGSLAFSSRSFAVALLACGSLLAGGCSRPTIKMDGSSTVYPISEAVVEEFSHDRRDVRVIVGRSGTGGGFKKFSHNEIDVCNASRPITATEKEACQKNGIEYVELEIAFDGLAVVVNPKNDWCDCLTVDQLKAIWQPEKSVSKWSDLNSAWPDQPIKLYGPGTDSGTFDYFTEVIVGKTGSSRDDYMQSEDDNVLVTGVAGDLYSLCYFGLAYFEENQQKLKLLGVDAGDGNCVKPTQVTVRDHSYKPLSRPLYIYVRKSALTRPELKAFVEFYLEKVGKVVEVVGYVPLPDDIAAKSKQALEEALATLKPAS